MAQKSPSRNLRQDFDESSPSRQTAPRSNSLRTPTLFSGKKLSLKAASSPKLLSRSADRTPEDKKLNRFESLHDLQQTHPFVQTQLEIKGIRIVLNKQMNQKDEQSKKPYVRVKFGVNDSADLETEQKYATENIYIKCGIAQKGDRLVAADTYLWKGLARRWCTLYKHMAEECNVASNNLVGKLNDEDVDLDSFVQFLKDSSTEDLGKGEKKFHSSFKKNVWKDGHDPKFVKDVAKSCAKLWVEMNEKDQEKDQKDKKARDNDDETFSKDIVEAYKKLITDMKEHDPFLKISNKRRSVLGVALGGADLTQAEAGHRINIYSYSSLIRLDVVQYYGWHINKEDCGYMTLNLAKDVAHHNKKQTVKFTLKMLTSSSYKGEYETLGTIEMTLQLHHAENLETLTIRMKEMERRRNPFFKKKMKAKAQVKEDNNGLKGSWSALALSDLAGKLLKEVEPLIDLGVYVDCLINWRLSTLSSATFCVGYFLLTRHIEYWPIGIPAFLYFYNRWYWSQHNSDGKNAENWKDKIKNKNKKKLGMLGDAKEQLHEILQSVSGIHKVVADIDNHNRFLAATGECVFF